MNIMAELEHVLVEEIKTGNLVCCFRFLPLTGSEISRSYSAQYYDLSALEVTAFFRMQCGQH